MAARRSPALNAGTAVDNAGLRTVIGMSAMPAPPQLIPAKILSDALAALGAYAEPPTEQELTQAQADEGGVALTVRLANALPGPDIWGPGSKRAKDGATASSLLNAVGPVRRLPSGDHQARARRCHYAARGASP
jgi:hypothetical protein